ncbi:MAG: ATP-grasp domain-containing protein [Litorimonas sp.]
MRIGLLASSNLLPGHADKREDAFEFDEELASLRSGFAPLGLSVEPVLWDEADQQAQNFDALLPLMVWDYFEGNETRFLDVMARAEVTTPVLNTPDLLRWNSDKSYLEELAERGAKVIPTLRVDGVTPDDAARAFDSFDTDRIVIKPQVGGGAWRQALYAKGEPWPDADKLPPEGALIQPFLPSVTAEGEYSFLYFGGAFSHALLKTAKPGDYRIQSLYGGAEESYGPTEAEKTVAQAVLATLDTPPLYARVDLLRGLDGQLALIELEMIEPYLYLPHAEVIDGVNQGAMRLGRAIMARLAA